MAYDQSKDKLIQDLGPVPGTDLTAELRQYDGGAVKVAFVRHFTKKNGEDNSRRVFSLPLEQAGPVSAFLGAVAGPQEPAQAEEEPEVETY